MTTNVSLYLIGMQRPLSPKVLGFSPVIKERRPADFSWPDIKSYFDWVIEFTGGSHEKGNYEAHEDGGKKEKAWKVAHPLDARHGLKCADLDLAYFGNGRKALLAVSFKCGPEAFTNGDDVEEMLSILRADLPLLEVRQLNGDVGPEASAFEAHWIRDPSGNVVSLYR